MLTMFQHFTFINSLIHLILKTRWGGRVRGASRTGLRAVLPLPWIRPAILEQGTLVFPRKNLLGVGMDGKDKIGHTHTNTYTQTGISNVPNPDLAKSKMQR